MHASLFFFSAPSLLVFFSHSDRSVVAWMKKGELQDTWIKWEDPIYFDYHLWSWSPTHSPSDYGVCVVNQLKFPTNSKDTVASSKKCWSTRFFHIRRWRTRPQGSIIPRLTLTLVQISGAAAPEGTWRMLWVANALGTRMIGKARRGWGKWNKFPFSVKASWYYSPKLYRRLFASFLFLIESKQASVAKAN